jgi:hypothetical protein
VETCAVNLNDLADVNAPSPADLDRLRFDADSGLWVPDSGWEDVEATTITYPAGDNGWMLVDESVSEAITYQANSSTVPAADAALVYEFTVTEAMLGDLPNIDGILPGLGISLSGTGWSSAFATMWYGFQVNGTTVLASSHSGGSTTQRWVIRSLIPVKVNDVVKVHLWMNTGHTPSANFGLVAAAPTAVRLGVPVAADGQVELQWWPANPELGGISVKPDSLSGIAMELASGSLTWLGTQTRRDDSTLVANASVRNQNPVLYHTDADTGSYFWSSNANSAGTVNTSSGDRFLGRIPRFTSMAYKRLLLPRPA